MEDVRKRVLRLSSDTPAERRPSSRLLCSYEGEMPELWSVLGVEYLVSILVDLFDTSRSLGDQERRGGR